MIKNKIFIREKLNSNEMNLVEEEKLLQMSGASDDVYNPQSTTACLAVTLLFCPTNKCTVDCPWAPWN
ncbi:class II lanthipeptide, LchA2/BrtA2 family [Bacillus swezeyi]|uniref:class II lanthipeptide, LchA2/BrtA2 family n=1 Tax=Bacillus swezeyi TaxID=1925020 RepID=UPI002E23334E|nr:class II lanthipeptide, LchA2/BrtA2 family [Bacillus swezeyi]